MREIVEKFLVSNWSSMGDSGEVPGKQLEFNGKNSKIRSFRDLDKMVLFLEFISIGTSA